VESVQQETQYTMRLGIGMGVEDTKT
jgi:hypothetical protein